MSGKYLENIHYSKNSKILNAIHKWETKKFKTKFLKKQFLQKNSLFRNMLAGLLFLWREYRSLVVLEKITNISTGRLCKLMKYCSAYNNRKYGSYGTRIMRNIERNKNKDIKGSKYRNKVALCLKTWKKLRSIIETAKELKTEDYLVLTYSHD